MEIRDAVTQVFSNQCYKLIGSIIADDVNIFVYEETDRVVWTMVESEIYLNIQVQIEDTVWAKQLEL